MSRLHEKNTRLYINGYDMSGYSRSVGPCVIEVAEHDLTVWTDTIKGYLKGHTQTNLGTYTGVLDDTATVGSHAVLSAGAGQSRTVIVGYGFDGIPAAGDPAFGGTFLQGGYNAAGEGGVFVTVPFQGWSSTATSLLYAGGMGQLLHASGAEIAANAANGVDSFNSAASARGGLFVYQVLAGDGTATLSVDDSVLVGGAYAALAGATTGVIDCSVRSAGVIALSTATAPRQHLRWQIALGTATTVTFVSMFIRG